MYFLISMALAFTINFAVAEREAPKRPEVKPKEVPGRMESPEELKRRAEKEAQKTRLEREGNPTNNPGQAKGGIVTAPSQNEVPKAHEQSGLAETVRPLGGRNSRFSNRTENSQIEDGAALERLTREKLDPKTAEGVVTAQKQMLKELEGDEVATRGLLAREQMFLDAIGEKKSLDEEASRKFEISMSERLGGKKSKEDVEIMKTAACASDCGHKAMGRTCRRLTAFLKAAATLTPIAFAAAFNGFLNTQTVSADGAVKDQIQVSTGVSDPEVIIIKDLTKPIPEEDGALPRESTK